MGSRTELQTELEKLLGSRNVYFKPPENIKMNYPAIVYHRNPIANRHADDGVFWQAVAYVLILVSKSPDDPCVKKLSMLPTCRHVNSYVEDNLYHDVFEIYY